MKNIKYLTIISIISIKICSASAFKEQLDDIRREVGHIILQLKQVEKKIDIDKMLATEQSESTITSKTITPQKEEAPIVIATPADNEDKSSLTDILELTEEQQEPTTGTEGQDMPDISDKDIEAPVATGPALEQSTTDQDIEPRDVANDTPDTTTITEEQEDVAPVFTPTETNQDQQSEAQSDVEETETDLSQEKIQMTVNEEVTDLPSGAPTMQQILEVGTIQDDQEQELKILLQEKEKAFQEKFPSIEFLSLVGDLNLLHAYAEATKKYIKLFNEVVKKGDKESAIRLQARIEETKQKYSKTIQKINEEYKTTEWYGFYVKK
ncbi:hypothetical protein KC460_04665 [Candidatus Dependentiae bacterium]|nr:hypothetical protein [Candidatus Dependentiae bacterium]